jgi:aminoglycoside 6'-N-acetyltransferase
VPVPPLLVTPRLSLRPGTPADVPLLTAILAEPAVAAWWGTDDTEDDLAAALAGDEPDVTFLVIEVDRDVAGGIQLFEEPDRWYRHAAIDVFLGTRWQGRGLGGEAVARAARYLLDERGHHRLTIDPAVDNDRAVRCHERLGFRRVGVMRQYERAPDGRLRDGLLMDLLAGELVEPEPVMRPAG